MIFSLLCGGRGGNTGGGRGAAGVTRRTKFIYRESNIYIIKLLSGCICFDILNFFLFFLNFFVTSQILSHDSGSNSYNCFCVFVQSEGIFSF